MISPDTSVVIAAFTPWNTLHEPALEALQRATDRHLIGHVAVETVAALSRMPDGHRVAADVVLGALRQTFPRPWIALDGPGVQAALERAVTAGLTGGAFYDALIAGTATANGLRLLSADRRARTTYDSLGVDVEFVA